MGISPPSTQEDPGEQHTNNIAPAPALQSTPRPPLSRSEHNAKMYHVSRATFFNKLLSQNGIIKLTSQARLNTIRSKSAKQGG